MSDEQAPKRPAFELFCSDCKHPARFHAGHPARVPQAGNACTMVGCYCVVRFQPFQYGAQVRHRHIRKIGTVLEGPIDRTKGVRVRWDHAADGSELPYNVDLVPEHILELA